MNSNPETPNTHSTSQAAHGRRSTWVLVTTAVVGGVVLFATIAIAGLSGVSTASNSSNSEPQLLTVDASEMKHILVDASAADVTVNCDRSGQHANELAVLTVSEGGQRWAMSLEGETLRVGTEHGPFAWLNNINLFGWNSWQPQTIAVSLPEKACKSDSLGATFDLSSGRLVAEGNYGELSVNVSAGDARISGSARSVVADVSAGSANLNLTDVGEARFDLSAGNIQGILDGTAPADVHIDVSAGEANIQLPDVPYFVTSDVSAGKLDNRLDVGGSSAIDHLINVDVSAGKVVLRPGS